VQITIEIANEQHKEQQQEMLPEKKERLVMFLV
jgi:hypothetical protein